MRTKIIEGVECVLVPQDKAAATDTPDTTLGLCARFKCPNANTFGACKFGAPALNIDHLGDCEGGIWTPVTYAVSLRLKGYLDG